MAIAQQEPQASTQRFIPLNEAKAKAWVASLPLADPGETTRRVFHGLVDLNRRALPPQTRLAISELLRPAVDVALDGGALGPERKLYLRELIARGVDLNADHAGLTPLLAATRDPYVAQPQPYWGNQRIWQQILGTLGSVPAARGTQFFQEARAIMVKTQADYVAGRFPNAKAALDAAAQQISQATGLPIAR